MFFVKNPVRLNIQSNADEQDLRFLNTSLRLEYWHSADPDKPVDVRCVRCTRRSTEEALDPELWRLRDLYRLGRVRVVELQFLGRAFTKLLGSDTLVKREAELGESYLLRRDKMRGDAQGIAAARTELTTALRKQRQSLEPAELAVYAQYNAIVRQESVELWFAGNDDNQVEFKMTDGTSMKMPNQAGVIVELSYV